METQELLKRVRKIEIKTRGLSNQIFSGEYHSAFKGRGMAFSEVREYMPGDEIRSIDWNVTARLNEPYVKVFEEERELTVMLLVDVSASENFGTRERLKRELITELCAVLSFSAIQNNDKIGVIFFSDQIEKFIPPKKGRSHILRIIRELLEFKPEHKGTDIAQALAYLTNVIKKRSTCFVLSDFRSNAPFTDALKIANKKHDIVALTIKDIAEEALPDVGLIPMLDPESLEYRWVDTSSESVQKAFKVASLARQSELENSLKRCGVEYTTIHSDKNYVKPLLNLFKKRETGR